MIGQLLRRAIKPLMLRISVRHGVTLGRNVHVGPFTVVSSPTNLTIGDHTYIGKSCTIQVSGRIGRGVLIANNVGIIGRNDHDFRETGVPLYRARWVETDPMLAASPENSVDIGDDVWLGFGSVVLSGVKIGVGAIVAAGAVVTKSVEPFTIVAGSPARSVGRRFSSKEAEAIHLAALNDEKFR